MSGLPRPYGKSLAVIFVKCETRRSGSPWFAWTSPTARVPVPGQPRVASEKDPTPNNSWSVIAYIAPALLSLVALVQLWSAHNRDLTPWKGGGFGMFSSIDRPKCRVLTAQLVTPRGSIPIRLDLISGSSHVFDVAIASPSEARMRELVRDLERRVWVEESLPIAQTQLTRAKDCASIAFGGHSTLSSGLPVLTRHAVEKKSRPAGQGGTTTGDLIANPRVKVEVLRLRFDSHSRALSLNRLSSRESGR